MIETQALMSKIAALRQRLEQAQGLVKDAGSAAAALLAKGGDGAAAHVLEGRIAGDFQHHALLEATLRQLQGPNSASTPLPAQLTARASRLLQRGQELLSRLRSLTDEPLLQPKEDGPLPGVYREATVLTDLVLRTLQAFPESPSTQLRLCEGLEITLHLAADKLDIAQRGVAQRRRNEAQLDELASLLTALAKGALREWKHLEALAQSVLAEALEARPIRFLNAPAAEPARFVAAHSLTVAQVVARVLRHDPEWRGRLPEALVAALVHDVGMLRVPVEILTHHGPLDDGQRRLLEAHPSDGAELVARLDASASSIIEATAEHHERIDGTGYAAGLRDTQINPLVRVLAVCDVYAGLCAPRPHRPARETRTALTDTLLLAEQGALDRYHAERLLALSFYPTGSVVELADGSVGMVVATHPGRRELSSPARPVLALLTDAHGQALPAPQHVDLGECEGRSIVRTLAPSERQELLGKRYPLWA